MALKILYEDKDIVVVIKPRGVLSQSSSSFEEDMVSLLKKHLGGDCYIGVIHRLDKPVYGVMVYGKNKRATDILCSDLRKKNIGKIYEALVEGLPSEDTGRLTDFIKKENNNISRIADKNTKDAKEAILEYKVVDTKHSEGTDITRLRINLLTGRHHQIRLQCAAHGFPLFGDYKYNKRLAKEKLDYDKVLTLAAVELSFNHPKTGKNMNFKIDADF